MELTRTQAEALAAAVPRSGGWKAGMWQFEAGGRPLIVKDVRYAAPLYRYTIGQFLLARELRIYRHIRSLSFIAPLVARIDRDAAAWERIDAQPVNSVPPPLVDERFAARLEECVRALHRAGVVHLDLRHLKNILMTPAGDPILIDFESALYLGTGWLGQRVLIPLLAGIDLSAVDKMSVQYLGDRVPDTVRRRHERFTRLRRALWPFGRLWPPPFLRRRR